MFTSSFICTIKANVFTSKVLFVLIRVVCLIVKVTVYLY